MRRLLASPVLLGLLAVAAAATPTVVQTCATTSYASSAITCTFSKSATNGDVIVVSDGGAAFGANGTTASVTGCNVSSWTADETDSTQGDAFILSHGVTGGGSCAVTITFSASPSDNGAVLAIEVSGISGTVDAKAITGSNCNGCASQAGASVTTTAAGDFVVAALGPPVNSSNQAAVSPPFSAAAVPGTGSVSIIATAVQPSAAAISATYTFPATYTYLANAIVAFKPSGGAPACIPTIMTLGAGCK